MIYSVKTYAYAKKEGNGWKNCPLISSEEAIHNLKDGVNKNMNYRLEDDKECLVFGDIDHCPDEETANKIYKLICKDFEVNDDNISKSYCYKENVKEYSYHWSISSLKTDFKTLKNIFNQDKYKEFKNMVDTSIYKNSWFRLPYQTAKEKPLYLEIIQGKPEDFLVQNIPEDIQLFKYEITNNKKNKENDMKQTKPIKITDEDYKENDYKIIQLLDLNLLDKKGNGNWDDWAEVGMAMKSSNPNGIDNFIRFSKINNNKYDDNKTVEFWNGIKLKTENEKKLSMGSLMMWAKECNPEENLKNQD
jgi:hypothetical protein